MALLTLTSQQFDAIVIGIVVLWVVVALVMGSIASYNGFSGGAFFLLTLVIGWPIPLLVIQATGKYSPIARAVRGAYDGDADTDG